MLQDKAYAKINLTLNILNKREDGYHNLKSVMLPINLYDELTYELNDTYELITDFDIKTEDNIITKVFNIFKSRYNISNVKITLKKNIPDKAGLAGGSSDATSVIRSLNKLFNLNLDVNTLQEIANEVGSDTLFTLHSKAAVITSRGDIIEFINCNCNFNVLLIKPKFGVSTKDAFSNIKTFDIKHNDTIIEEVKNNNVSNINNLCYNSFLDYLLQNKEFNSLYENISKFQKPHLSGSGSTLFVISDDIKYLEEIQNNFKEHFTKITNIINTK